MIVAVSSIRNEEAIIAKTITHLLAVGADHLIVSDGYSTDSTFDILQSLDNVTALRQDGPFVQPDEILRLSGLANEMGADWIVPFDADEFWCDLSPLLEADAVKVFATVYGHQSWELRHEQARRLPKCCYRETTMCHWGNHDAATTGEVLHGLEIRELQYQSFEHFLAKIEKSRELFAASDFHPGYGSHMRALVAMSDEERAAEWDRLCAIPTVVDPIPYRGAR